MRRIVPFLVAAIAIAALPETTTAADPSELGSAASRIRALETENAALREELERRSASTNSARSDDSSRESDSEPETSLDSSFSFSLHRDTRGYSTLGVVSSIQDLPFGLSVWGFTDLHGQQSGNRWIDTARSFSEYRLSKPISFVEGLGLQAEVNDGSRLEDGLARFGMTYRHPFSLAVLGLESSPGWLQWRAFPVDTTGDGAQLSWIYHLPITERFSFGGFADYNIRSGPNRWVIEPELRFRIWRNLSLLLEYRLNEFENAAAGLRGSGLAIGIRAAL